MFLNTPPSAEDEDFETAPETKEEKEKEDEVKDKRDKEAQLEESTINFILNMEDPDYKDPKPCTGLTCPLTGEQYYVD